MCGLVGYFLWREAPAPSLTEALQLLRHRGPDAARTWESPQKQVGLAHTRLSILDLSDAAHQPFGRDSVWVVYNGEIYNFWALASEGGFPMETRSDTEALLRAYLTWGEASVQRLEGMFAFALYDERENKLLLARDPFGIKPLWVAVLPEGVYFASELKVLRSWLPTLSVRHRSVAEFLHLGFVPAPHSWYEGVYKVLPGELWRIRRGEVTREVYYDRSQLWHQEILQAPIEAIEEQVESQLRIAVKAHLLSDVPVGLFLSGGTDSSLVAALAAKEGHALQTFSIGFAEEGYNELPYAAAVAAHLGLPFAHATLRPEEALSLLPHLLEWFDEPFGDVSALPTYLVSRLAAAEVKVVLAGDGGDELYGGYGRYRWAARIARLKPWLPIGAHLLSYWPSPRGRRVAQLLTLPQEGIPEHIFSQEERTFSWREIQHLLPETGPPWQTSYRLPSEAAIAQAAWDFLHYLPDDLLTKVDRASMQHSLEVRVPLLDKRWVELAWRIPPPYKIPIGKHPPQYKPILRRILQKYLPPALVQRKKWGFTIPLARWLQGPLQEWARTYADPRLLNQAYGFSIKPVQRLWHSFSAGEEYMATRLWLLTQIGRMARP
ncbi:MAG: asparagine synthase (glutamine-hydrolyzing) [Bacteroidia bacterium]|nr:asparagine synthase (glutamine-hydrolyzing) [Bacteroidia bacterium]